MDDEPIDLVIIDADSMVYEIACVSKNTKHNTKALLAKIEGVIQDLQAKTAYVYIKGENNFRHQCADDYKANRKDNLTPKQREVLAALYLEAKEFCISSDNAEADDYCGIMAKWARDNDMSFIISHIDKDLNGLEGTHHNFRKGKVYSTDKEFSYRFMMKQFLTGDSADNIKGLWKVGPVGAGKIMDGVPVEQLWDTLVSTWCTRQEGDWKKELVRCVNCIYIRESMHDLRLLTFEELKERLQWNTDTDTGLLIPNDPKRPGASCTSLPILSVEDDTLAVSN